MSRLRLVRDGDHVVEDTVAEQEIIAQLIARSLSSTRAQLDEDP